MVSVWVRLRTPDNPMAKLRALPYTPDQEDSSIGFHRVLLGVFRQPSLLSIDTWAVDNSLGQMAFILGSSHGSLKLPRQSTECRVKQEGQRSKPPEMHPDACLAGCIHCRFIRLRSKFVNMSRIPKPFSC